MRRRLVAATVALLAAVSATAHAQELISNGNLELVFPDRGGRDSVPPGWSLFEGPPVPADPNAPVGGDYNDDGLVDAADYVVWRKGGPLLNEVESFGVTDDADHAYWRTQYGNPPRLTLAEPGDFSHINYPDDGGDWNVWFQPYLGTEAEQEENFAHLTQAVPGTAGTTYRMVGHALFENFFPGGVENLNLETGGTATGEPFDDGPMSPTDTFFALEFLNSDGAVLSGGAEIELKAAGQPSNTTWKEHVLTATAPAGTTSVRVRASMLNGVYNPLPAPQVFQMSFFVDAFSLTVVPAGQGAANVPEPAGWLLASIAAACAMSRRRRHVGHSAN